MGIFLLLFCIQLWLPASPGDRESIPGFSRAAEPALPILHPRKIPFFPLLEREDEESLDPAGIPKFPLENCWDWG